MIGRLVLVVLVALVALPLAACGKRGPLELPPDMAVAP